MLSHGHQHQHSCEQKGYTTGKQYRDACCRGKYIIHWRCNMGQSMSLLPMASVQCIFIDTSRQWPDSVFTSRQEIDIAVKHLYTLHLLLAKALPHSDQGFIDHIDLLEGRALSQAGSYRILSQENTQGDKKWWHTSVAFLPYVQSQTYGTGRLLAHNNTKSTYLALS
jgi:hypothetical protein